MNDFKGSVAEQDVTISTEIVKTAVVGENYYTAILYVTDRFEDFGNDTPVYPVVTKNTYADVIDDYAYLSAEEKKIIKANLKSLYAYGDVTAYIIPASEVANRNLYAYFTYLDLKWTVADGTTNDYALDATAEQTLLGIKDFDKAFTRPVTEMPVDPSKVKGTSLTSTQGTFALLVAKELDLTVFARAAIPSGTVSANNAYLDSLGDLVGDSPALYQLGRSLSDYNASQTPVGSDFDMRSVEFMDVLPTAETDVNVLAGASGVFANWFESVYINYFKPVGNGTMRVNNFGGWTIRANCVGAEWSVAYLNFVNRVACATIITSGLALKNQKTYKALLNAVVANISRFTLIGRIVDLVVSAPSFENLPISNGHTIIIPDAWRGTYVDNVRKVKISGTLTVAA